MKKEVYELKTCPEDTAVSLGVVRLNTLTMVQDLINRIPMQHVAEFLATCYSAEPGSFTDSPEQMNDHILTVEGDFAGLLIRNRWAGDDELQIKPLLSALATASTDFYDTLQGQVRLEKIRLMTLELLSMNP